MPDDNLNPMENVWVKNSEELQQKFDKIEKVVVNSDVKDLDKELNCLHHNSMNLL